MGVPWSGWPPASAASGIEFFNPLFPPQIPNAKNDEFLAASGLWTEADAGNYATFALNASRRALRASGSGNGGRQLAYYAQTIPGGVGGEFALYTRVGLVPYTAGGAASVSAGLFVGNDVIADPAGADIRSVIAYGNTTNAGVSSGTFLTYNGAPINVTSRDPMAVGFLRIRQNGLTCNTDFSPDGYTWYRLAQQALGGNPTHCGLVFESIGNTIAGVAYFDFFRCFNGAGTSAEDGTFIGRYAA